MLRPLLVCTTLLAATSTASAQTLRDRLGELLTFGSYTTPLQVGTLSADGQSILTSNAFQATAANAAFSTFLANWMTASAASAPIASSGAGRTFRFVGGVPVEDRPSPGPIFGERATTLGRGAVLAGVNYTNVQFTRVRGVPLDAVSATLTQGAAAANAAQIDLRLGLDYRMAVTTLYATAGVLDRLDVGVVLPLVQSRLSGQSTATVIPGGAGTSPVVLGGTAAAPLTSSQQSVAGRATGIGDVALRAKLNLIDRPATGLGLLADVRLPTGNADNLLGSGSFSGRLLGVYSGQFGTLTPYVNAGYQYYARSTINSAFLATVGVDADVAPWATVSLGALGQRHAGASAYRMPTAEDGRALSNVPEIRDDALSATIGAKFGVRGVRATANVLAPFSRGGPRPDVAYTFGLERAF